MLSTVTQGDAVGLLSLGSAAAPSPKLLAGEEGSKQLVAVKEQGQKGLAAYFEQEKGAAAVLAGRFAAFAGCSKVEECQGGEV